VFVSFIWQKFFENGNIFGMLIDFSLQNSNFLAILISYFFHTIKFFTFNN